MGFHAQGIRDGTRVLALNDSTVFIQHPGAVTGENTAHTRKLGKVPAGITENRRNLPVHRGEGNIIDEPAAPRLGRCQEPLLGKAVVQQSAAVAYRDPLSFGFKRMLDELFRPIVRRWTMGTWATSITLSLTRVRWASHTAS